MSFADPALSPAPSAREGQAPRTDLGESRTWIDREVERSPSLKVSLPKVGSLRLATDRVRARPAVTPTVSGAIGVTAVGLGVAGLFFPKQISNLVGLKAPTQVVQGAMGAREMWSGLSLVGDPTKSSVLWARVAGDVFDLAVLRSLDRPDNPKRSNVKAALVFVAAVTLLDAVTATRMSTVQRNCD